MTRARAWHWFGGMLLFFIRIFPQRLLSRGWGWLARRELPPVLQVRINRGFARVFTVDVSEAERRPEEYRSLSAFFVRRLRKGVRDWPPDHRVLASPADGVLGCVGPLAQGMALQAKGISYNVSELLGSAGEASGFRSGLFLTIYLSPRHYHRVHAPCAARLHTARVVPGRLLPVNPTAVGLVPGLFPGNERLVTLMEANGVDLAVVAVGAYNVGCISADFDPNWDSGALPGVTNRSQSLDSLARFYDPPLVLEAGDALMAFHLGSTVILLVSPRDGSLLTLHPALREGSEVRLGNPLLASPKSSGVRGPGTF